MSGWSRWERGHTGVLKIRFLSSKVYKHIVKHIVSLLWENSFLGLSGSMLFLGALCPSKSGLMNKHIVNISGALCPSKSGLMNKHFVKHIVAPVPVPVPVRVLARTCLSPHYR